MAVRIKSQQDYLLTEANIELPCELSEVDYLMRTIRGSGRIVAQYSEGGLLGINVEQRSKIRAHVSDKVRALIGVESKEIGGQ
jgi:hypothetical protein